jgi:uncharacterized membrane protein YcaP (DUF421 family)
VIALGETIFRTFFGFAMMLTYIRILGKKQLGELTFFNYVTGIAIGNIAGDMVVHRDIKLIDAFVGITLWSSLTYILGYINLKMPFARKIFNGEPAIVIKRGVILHDILASHHINIDDLTMLLRNNNIFSVKEVDYAIIEANGQLSILKKPGLETVTRRDMNIPFKERKYIPTEIIVDGRLVERNLRELALDNKWLGQQLTQAGVSSVKEIFYAEAQEDGSLYIIRF